MERLVKHVDPFICTGGHGHSFPEAIQLSPNNGRSDWDWWPEYQISDDIIAGFGHLHLFGTGIGDLGDLLFMPVNKEVELPVVVRSWGDFPYKYKFRHSNKEAFSGHFRIFPGDQEVDVELTTSVRTGYYKYSFKEGQEQAIVIDPGFAINWDNPTETAIVIEGKHTISGYRYST